jgi:hypothetical protein
LTEGPERWPVRLLDEERLESFGLLGLDRDVVHYGQAGSSARPFHQLADIIRCAFEDRFDSAVGKVTDPPGYAMFHG